MDLIGDRATLPEFTYRGATSDTVSRDDHCWRSRRPDRHPACDGLRNEARRHHKEQQDVCNSQTVQCVRADLTTAEPDPEYRSAVGFGDGKEFLRALSDSDRGTSKGRLP